MYPHMRILLASLAYSFLVAAAIASAAYVSALYLGSLPVTEPIDNAPIRGAGVLLYVGTPLAFLLSMAISIPLSYSAWRQRPIRGARVAALVLGTSLVLALVLAYAAGALGGSILMFAAAAAIIFAGFSVVLGAAALAWLRLMPSALTSGWSDRGHKLR